MALRVLEGRKVELGQGVARGIDQPAQEGRELVSRVNPVVRAQGASVDLHSGLAASLDPDDGRKRRIRPLHGLGR
jgi:hypothetical protein